jgi:hypothetical protein
LLKEFGPKFEIVVPSMSILAEPSVAVVDKVVDKKGTRAVAEEYLKYLYSDEGQDIAGRNFYRPASQKAKAKYDKQFPKLNAGHHRPGLRRLGQGRQGALSPTAAPSTRSTRSQAKVRTPCPFS